MGANYSKSIQATSQQLITDLRSACHPTGQATQEIKDIKIELHDNTKCNTIKIENRAAAASECNLDSLVTNLAKSVGELTEEQKAGLGFNVSESVQDNKIAIKNYLQQECGSSSAINQVISGGNFAMYDNAQCDLLAFMNTADAKSGCIVKTVNDNVADILQKTTKKQTGFDPTMSCVSLLIIVVVIGVIGMGVTGGAGKLLMAGGGMILVGLILIIVGAVVWNNANKKNESAKTGQIIVGIGVGLFLIGVIVVVVGMRSKKAGFSAESSPLLGSAEDISGVGYISPRQMGAGKRSRGTFRKKK